MKKLITAAMVLALAAGFASAQTTQVTSSNIVGYVTITNVTGNTYPTLGNCFITVGDVNTEAKLGDITADGMDPLSDLIQFLDPDTLAVTLLATYVDATTAAEWSMEAGWYNLDLDTSLDDTALPAGTAFLGTIGSGNTVVFTFAGEVVQDSIALDLTGQTYPFVANTVPADLTLGDITADGMDPLSDLIQFLDPTTLAATLLATYVDAATAAEWSMEVGWYNLDLDTSLDDTSLPAGTAFLGTIGSGNPVTIVFPNPVAP